MVGSTNTMNKDNLIRGTSLSEQSTVKKGRKWLVAGHFYEQLNLISELNYLLSFTEQNLFFIYASKIIF